MEFVKQHLDQLKLSFLDNLDPDEVGGKVVKTFCEGLSGVEFDTIPTGLFNERGQISRSKIFELVNSRTTNTATLCAVILAWGGMRMTNHKAFFDQKNEGWIDLADRMITGEVTSRHEAYESFLNLSNMGKLIGVGPAYFTKLIYFLLPRKELRDTPFIMDQWAACSVNLLLGKELVKMNVNRLWKRHSAGMNESSTYSVSEVNFGKIYDEFCAAISQLCAIEGMSRDPDVMDRHLLATGGKKNQSSWRKYVIDHRHEFIGR